MSIEITLFPAKATREALRLHVLKLGFESSPSYIRGLTSFFLFSDDLSNRGLEATIRAASTAERALYKCSAYVLHTRTAASASRYDRSKQNETIREARRQFGGTFYNDWYGSNRYIPVAEETTDQTVEERLLARAYYTVDQSFFLLEMALPADQYAEMLARAKKGKFPPVLRMMQQIDPSRVLYSALVPFIVAGLEFFLRSAFKTLIRFDAKAQAKLAVESRRVSFDEVRLVSQKERTVEDVVSDWYSFQNIHQIHTAFRDWLAIDFRGLLRSQHLAGEKLQILDEHLVELIQYRHGVVHRFDFDTRVGFDELKELIGIGRAVVNHSSITSKACAV